MKILYKYPTRERPLLFSRTLKAWYGKMVCDNFHFLIACDTDDSTMNNDEARQFMSSFKNLTVRYDINKNKIEACNRGVSEEQFDVVVLVSDDMLPEVHGYDRMIVERMQESFPDTDGAIWLFDGYNPNINTLSILGRKYYERFNYIYHPSYVTQWCDQEHTDIAKELGKLKRYDDVLIRHIHPEVSALREDTRSALFNHMPEYQQHNFLGHDKLWLRNAKGDSDRENYYQRKAQGFPK